MVGKLSIVVPVYNEIATVEELLRRLAAVRFPIEREIIVVNDGSFDGSQHVLQRLSRANAITLIVHKTNRGKGAAVQTALRHATGDVVVIQDADLELDPNDLPTLLEPIRAGETQVCYGSRFLNGIPWRVRRRPTYWVNVILNKISNRLNGIHITDFNTCYKMMTAEVASRVSITQNGFAMEPEITGKLARLGYKIVERPVRYEPRSVLNGKKTRLVDLLKYVAAMFRYRFLWSGDVIAARQPRVRESVSIPTSCARG